MQGPLRSAHLHIGICQLQLVLCKVCLLLGVNVRLGKQLLQRDGQLVQTHAGSTEDNECETVRCDILIEAGGPNGLVWRSAGLTFNTVGTAEAIGLVANFARGPATPVDLKEFSWARQFNQNLFEQLEAQTRANLENIVYLVGENSHYFVMTPRRTGLIAAGVLKEDVALSDANVRTDKSALRSHVRAIASFFQLSHDCSLP